METGPDIITIGAGPSGLVAALTVLQEGQEVAIYDALPKGPNGSRAPAIHAHTLEVTPAGSSTGISQGHPVAIHWDTQSSSSQGGVKAQGVVSYDRTTPILQTKSASYLQGLTEYPFVLLVPQHEVGLFLEAKLNEHGVKVRREMQSRELQLSTRNRSSLPSRMERPHRQPILLEPIDPGLRCVSNNVMNNELKG